MLFGREVVSRSCRRRSRVGCCDARPLLVDRRLPLRLRRSQQHSRQPAHPRRAAYLGCPMACRDARAHHAAGCLREFRAQLSPRRPRACRLPVGEHRYPHRLRLARLPAVAAVACPTRTIVRPGPATFISEDPRRSGAADGRHLRRTPTPDPVRHLHRAAHGKPVGTLQSARSTLLDRGPGACGWAATLALGRRVRKLAACASHQGERGDASGRDPADRMVLPAGSRSRLAAAACRRDRRSRGHRCRPRGCVSVGLPP